MNAGKTIMIRRLGFAAVLMALSVPLLVADDAAAQGKRPRAPGPEAPAPLPTGPVEKTFPLGASWSVTELNGKSVYNYRATVLIDQNLRGTGFAGCNTFSAAAYPLRQQGFAVGPIAVTKRSCDKAAQDFERQFLLAMRGVRNWDIANGNLVLKGAAGEIKLNRSI